MTYQDVLSALANPTRRLLLESLRNQPQTVGELSSDQAVSRPAVSQHLKVLKQAGLVTNESKGTRRIYSTSAEGLIALRRYLDDYWSDALEAYGTEINRRQTK
ncbi:MAG: winged helix-turn-helix transcriptional regulator [Granulosicoccus sp.]|nr:winged helix-turn-helix transcriptional regulator [Granulosicoccus sp.]